MAIVITEFPSGSEHWRVEWIGRISRSALVDSEPQVALHLTRLAPGYQSPLSNQAITAVARTCWIGVGQLGLVPMGSVWCDRQLFSTTSPALHDWVIHRTDCTWITFDTLIDIGGRAVPAISPSGYRVNAFESIRKAYLIHSRRRPGQPDIFIPAGEILRACGCLSADLAKALLDADFSRLLDPDQTGWLDADTYRIRVGQRIWDAEAFLVAEWAATAAGQRLFGAVKRMIVSNQQDVGQDGSGSHYQYAFPGYGDIRLKVVGKWLSLAKDMAGKTTHWGYLVTRILRWDTGLSYRKLVIDRVNSSGQGSNRDDPQLPAGGWRVSARQPEETALTSRQAPNHGGTRQPLLASQVTFGGQWIEQIHAGKALQQTRSVSLPLEQSEKGANRSSTADPVGGAGPVRQADVRQEPQRLSPPVTLDLFLDTLRVLRARGVPVQSCAPGSFTLSWQDDIGIGYYPLKVPGRLSWHRIETTPVRGRGFVVVRLGEGATAWYAVELERKQDQLSLILFRPQSGLSPGEPVLARILMSTARQGRWPIEDLQVEFEVATVVHPRSRLPEDFARLIGRRLQWAGEAD